MEQEVRIKGLDSDKISEVKSEVMCEIRSKVSIEEVLDLWLRAGVGE